LETSAGHAGEFETSFAMVAFPHRIRPDQINYENAKLATISKGGQILAAVIDGVSEQVQKMLTE
jgi:creatinine amidohydrolase/Fe(II)-dependent formamide hydrolase-like protein